MLQNLLQALAHRLPHVRGAVTWQARERRGHEPESRCVAYPAIRLRRAGKHKGTPILREGVKCILKDDDEDDDDDTSGSQMCIEKQISVPE